MDPFRREFLGHFSAPSSPAPAPWSYRRHRTASRSRIPQSDDETVFVILDANSKCIGEIDGDRRDAESTVRHIVSLANHAHAEAEAMKASLAEAVAEPTAADLGCTGPCCKSGT